MDRRWQRVPSMIAESAMRKVAVLVDPLEEHLPPNLRYRFSPESIAFEQRSECSMIGGQETRPIFLNRRSSTCLIHTKHAESLDPPIGDFLATTP